MATLLAESIALDQLSGRLSVFHLIENATMVQVPSVAPPATLVIVYETEPERLDFAERVRIVGPGDAVAIESRAHVEGPARDPVTGPMTHTSLHFLPGIPIQAYGPHRLSVENGPATGQGPWETVAVRSLMVRRPPPTPPVAAH